MTKFTKQFDTIITTENLLIAWNAFLKGKRQKKDVMVFQNKLMDNVQKIKSDLSSKTYIHGKYISFHISDPKPRIIHKATVSDRLIHHLLYQEFSGFFDQKFIYDSYSCRVRKGVHRALRRFNRFSRKASKNNTKTCWILKCDIRKFFANIDHNILKNILKRYIIDDNILWLFDSVIDSFSTENKKAVGLPLGNLTSQLLINIYMNEFDQYVKRELKVKYYVRYADDFVVFNSDKKYLDDLIPKFGSLLESKLKLSLHPNKVLIKTLSSKIDFLGWVHSNYFRVLRTSTKNRMLKNIRNDYNENSLHSYLGMLIHGNGHFLSEKIKNYTKNPPDLPNLIDKESEGLSF